MTRGGRPLGQSQAGQHRWDGTYPLHPFLFAFASVLALMATSLNQTSLDDVAAALAGAFLFALAVYLAIAAIRRRFDARTAILASTWVVGGLFYAGLFRHLNSALDGGYSMVATLPFALAAMLIVTALIALVPFQLKIPHTVLNTIAAVMLLTPAWQAISYEWWNADARNVYSADAAADALAEPGAAEAIAAASEGQPPDIYHFIFDRYASEGILDRYYRVDNRAIGRFLEDNGFYLARNSHSNYLKTGHSLASTFYMDYLGLLDDERVAPNNWHPIHKMLDDHRVSRFLKARGYDFLQFGSWWVGTYDNPVADENHPHGFSEFNMLYLRRTVLRPLFHVLPDTPLTMRLDWDNAQCQRVAPQIEAIKAIGNRADPTYVFAHILIPHGPYNFAADGGCLTDEEARERGSEQGYIDHIAYANRIIEDIVTALLDERREPPVILIQADEGPFPERDGRVPWQEASAQELQIKTGILNAFYFPGEDYGALTSDVTPVNTYRIVFNEIFGARFPLLPDRIFAFPNTGALYDFHDVTEIVRPEVDDAIASPGSVAQPRPSLP